MVAVCHRRADVRRALRRSYPPTAGTVRVCRTLSQVERLFGQRLIDAAVLDPKVDPDAGLALAARFPHIPMFAMTAFRPDDGALVKRCQEAGVWVLIEGVDSAISGDWIAARTAQVARRQALVEAPRLLRLSDRLQLAAWAEVLGRVGAPITTSGLAETLRVTREHLSREFAAGGAPNLKRTIDLARVACAADLLGNPGYQLAAVVRILRYPSPRHLAAATRRVAGASPDELGALGPRGVLHRFIRGRTRSRA